jgi:transposase
MSNITLLAIDIAKNVFQLHGTNKEGKVILKLQVPRGRLLEKIANINPCKICMEACGSSNYWGREFQKLGHRVELMHPKYVKPYIHRNKNDVNDAAGIAKAARDPDAKFCDVRTEHQQDVQSTHRIRKLAIQQRTALANQIRGLLAEYGIIISKGINNIRKQLPTILDSNKEKVSGLMLNNMQGLYEDLVYLDKKIDSYNKKIVVLLKEDELGKRLMDVPGIGVLGATLLSSILGNGAAFKNGRHFAAFLGLTPKQHSSGEKERLMGISKGGDTYLRTLLIHGARSVLLRTGKKSDSQSVWLRNLKFRCGYNKAAVALANKIARVVCAIAKGGSKYVPNYKPKLIKSVRKGNVRVSGLARFGVTEGALARPL